MLQHNAPQLAQLSSAHPCTHVCAGRHVQCAERAVHVPSRQACWRVSPAASVCGAGGAAGPGATLLCCSGAGRVRLGQSETSCAVHLHAGWTSFNCIFPMKRHCANYHVSWGFERGRMEPNLSMGVGWESIFAFPRSHCAGVGLGWVVGVSALGACTECCCTLLLCEAGLGVLQPRVQIESPAGNTAARCLPAATWLQDTVTPLWQPASAPPTQPTAGYRRQRMPR